MRRTLAPAVALAVALALAGCRGTRTQMTALNPAPRPLAPRLAADVEVFSSAPPTRPYVDVALLEAEQAKPSRAATAALIAALRKRAAQHGCDAIVVLGLTSRDTEAFTRKGVYATCVVYTSTGAPGLVAGQP
jgi:hypothetical protein